MVLFNLGVEQVAGAATTCYDNGAGDYAWAGYETTYSHNQGVSGDIHYQANDVTITTVDHQHALSYVGVATPPNSDSLSTEKFDSLQAGFGIGNVDGQKTGTTQVFAEIIDQNSVRAHYYPTSQYPWGNRLFTVHNTGTTDGNGYGLYISLYSDQNLLLLQGWMINPHYTFQYAQIEGYAENFYYQSCPLFSHALFGSNGNESSPSWDYTTVTWIYTNSVDTGWTEWTPVSIYTVPHVTGPYSITDTYNDDDAFNSAGGG